MTSTCKRGHLLTPSNVYSAKPEGKSRYRVCKRCTALSRKRYNAKNKTKRDDYGKEYRAQNREKARQYAEAYRKKQQDGQ